MFLAYLRDIDLEQCTDLCVGILINNLSLLVVENLSPANDLGRYTTQFQVAVM